MIALLKRVVRASEGERLRCFPGATKRCNRYGTSHRSYSVISGRRALLRYGNFSGGCAVVGVLRADAPALLERIQEIAELHSLRRLVPPLKC